MIGLEAEIERKEREEEITRKITIHVSAILISFIKLTKDIKDYLNDK